ncbi:MAG TPA: type II toxin-antitoxin system PemK/MazF family toxin [Chthoniobacteraceae bacterium]|nr:type II toxin-antitoxin system PemK/MazF family toxin [Chthoniobacteraceae bacterium]
MKQWDIYLFPFDQEKAHPAVIISPDERVLNEGIETVNALICTSVKLNRDAKKTEVILNGADGLDWKTAVRCDVIYLLSKSRFKEMRGRVALPRRTAIARKIAESFRLQLA